MMRSIATPSSLAWVAVPVLALVVVTSCATGTPAVFRGAGCEYHAPFGQKRDLSLARNRAVRTLRYGKNRYKYFPSAVARGGIRPRRPGLVTR
jgi:hypothetical protein